jgi:hypothetical protein
MKRTYWVLIWIALMVSCVIAGWEFWLKFLMLLAYIVAYVGVHISKICGVVQ